jgi:dTDP-4-amino-4,6-dideoxygalactose transaminase
MGVELREKINVTKPFLPPQGDYIKFVEQIWQNEWLTNNGPLLQQFEDKLKDNVNTQQLLVMANGTLAIQIALRTLELNHGDEVITTPFSYVATTSSIVWEGFTPVFVDIDHNSFNIDPQKIEHAITPKTKAILATHVFGNPCDIDSISTIAKKYNLKVIYDAAHCFGVSFRQKSILQYGDASVLSLHATKLFHSVEGGVFVSNNPETIDRAKYLRNFGHDGYYKFNGVGINAKNSELHAAMGLVNFKYIDEILATRKRQWKFYFSQLQDSGLNFQKIHEECEYNYSYFPVLFNSETELVKKVEFLESNQIYCRRYFYPSLNALDYVKIQTLPVGEQIASRILCLPLYHDLLPDDQARIIEALKIK